MTTQIQVLPKNTVRRRMRTHSVSMDIEFPDFVERLPVYYKHPGILNNWSCHKSQIITDRFRSISSNYPEKGKLLDWQLTFLQVKGQFQLKIQPDVLPFQSLPDECKLNIFAMLSLKEKAICAQVCKNWSRLMKHSRLWSHIDFTLLPACFLCPEIGRDCSLLCYSSYKKRVKSFVEFLLKLNPCLIGLKFAFDIGDPKDGWLILLERLVRFSRCQELISVNMNWKDTPAKSSICKQPSTSTWSHTDCKNFKFDFRHRQRLFTNFFDFLTASAPNINQLWLPFHWSDRTLCCLCRLKNLKHLHLEHYFWMQELDQSHVSMLLSIDSLKTLTLEVWVPTGPGFQSYFLDSPALEVLDISACRGLYIGHLKMPLLRQLNLSRSPLFPPFYASNNPPQLPCLHEVLSTGAPGLRTLNQMDLNPDWRSCPSPQLELLLQEVCCCPNHR